MKEYIDRKAAEQAKPEFLNEKVEGYEKAIYAKGWNDCNTQYRENILSIPAADVVKVRHGKWIFGQTMGHSWMKCSECCVSQDGQTATFTYCPNCGAKMDGGIKNDDNI